MKKIIKKKKERKHRCGHIMGSTIFVVSFMVHTTRKLLFVFLFSCFFGSSYLVYLQAYAMHIYSLLFLGSIANSKSDLYEIYYECIFMTAFTFE